MEVRQIANSAAALRFGHWLGRHMPLRTGYALADGVSGLLARRKESALMRILHSNLRVVLGPDASDEQSPCDRARGARPRRAMPILTCIMRWVWARRLLWLRSRVVLWSTIIWTGCAERGVVLCLSPRI